jgi:hypothetical protein
MSKQFQEIVWSVPDYKLPCILRCRKDRQNVRLTSVSGGSLATILNSPHDVSWSAPDCFYFPGLFRLPHVHFSPSL